MFRSLKKSVFMSNHVDLNSKLHFYSCLVLSRLMYRAVVLEVLVMVVLVGSHECVS